MSETFTGAPSWSWCHEGTTLHILWQPGIEEGSERLHREFGRSVSPGEDFNSLVRNEDGTDNEDGIRRVLGAIGPYALCGTKDWKIRDGDGPTVGREDLICGECMDAFDERYGTQEQQVKSVTAAERYREHLDSDIWKRTRELALEFYGDRCCLCNSARSLNVHHRTYERVGSERLADLIVLCRDCHAKHHGQLA